MAKKIYFCLNINTELKIYTRYMFIFEVYGKLSRYLFIATSTSIYEGSWVGGEKWRDLRQSIRVISLAED